MYFEVRQKKRNCFLNESNFTFQNNTFRLILEALKDQIFFLDAWKGKESSTFEQLKSRSLENLKHNFFLTPEVNLDKPG